MGNSSTGMMSPTYSCYADEGLSKNSVTPYYWETASISDDYRANSLATAAIMLILVLVGVPCNGIIIISIIHQKLYRETTHILLLNLAISDLLVCVLVMPFVIVAGFSGSYVFGDSDYVRCKVCQSGLIFTLLTVLSLNIVGLISIDRFIFIKFPLRYSKYVTVPRVVLAVVIAWVLSTFEAIMPLFGFGDIRFAYPNTACLVSFVGESKLIGLNIYYAVVLIVLSLVPLTAIIVTNVLITCIAKKQISRVYRTRKSFRNETDLKTYNVNLRKHIRKRKNMKQLVLIRAFAAILIANIIVYFPLVIITILLLVLNDDKNLPLGMLTAVHFCLMIHSILHPLIEGCFIPEIKMTFKKIFGIVHIQKLIRQRKANAAIVNRSDDTLATQSMDLDGSEDNRPVSPTGSCLDNCNLALLPISQA